MKKYESVMRDYVKNVCRIKCEICAKYRCTVVKALEIENSIARLTENVITN